MTSHIFKLLAAVLVVFSTYASHQPLYVRATVELLLAGEVSEVLEKRQQQRADKALKQKDSDGTEGKH